MQGIRPLERADLPAVASLFKLVMRPGGGSAADDLARQFESLFFEHPWADPRIPSLVFVDRAARIRGFIGSHVRRASFEGTAVTIGCAGQLVTHPDARGPGLFLTRAYLAGRQDLTLTDTANEVARRMWLRLGAVSADLLGIDWIRPFRPWRLAAEVCCRRSSVLARAAGPLADGLDELTARRLCGEIGEPGLRLVAERLTEAALVEAVQTLPATVRLRPAYDERFVSWLFEELQAVGSSVDAVLLRDESGAAAGWYVSRLRPRATSTLLQLGALSQAAADGILRHALVRAASRGSTAVDGRLEPTIVDSLAGERHLLRSRRGVLLHGRRRELIDSVLTGAAFLSRLEGDSWIPFDSPARARAL